jgi:ribosomal protein S18 acetylase RimI-like enzyme
MRAQQGHVAWDGRGVTRQSPGEACDGNYAAAFAALIPHVGAKVGSTRAFGSVVAVATGLDIAFYNPVIAARPSASTQDLASAVDWVRSLGLSASVQLAEELRPRLEPALFDLGLEPDPWVTPGMALDPIPIPPEAPRELRIEHVDADAFDDWHEAIDYGPRFKRILGPTLLGDPTFRLVIGYLHDEPVAGAAAIVDDGVVGIYAVGTREHARGRGFGQAVTWGAVLAGVDAGCRLAVLQSTEVAVSLYRRMGFVEVRRYVEHLPARDLAQP